MVINVRIESKRKLVSLLRNLGVSYGETLNVTRESTDLQVKAAHRKILLRVHPDRGGCTADAQRLNEAWEKWTKTLAAVVKQGRPFKNRPTGAGEVGIADTITEQATEPIQDVFSERAEYRVCGEAVLLTYQSFVDRSTWKEFLGFVETSIRVWKPKVKHWCATAEENSELGVFSFHLHLMLQFIARVDRGAEGFSFKDIRPNVSTIDLAGEGLCKRKLQQSINRAMFYVWADKIGTVRDEGGDICVAGNYAPCWTSMRFRYQVLGRWPETLWKQRKVTDAIYEKYMYECRDGIPRGTGIT